MTIITRFAPSPTGLLHIGGARTALYNYLYAKNNKGYFKLRIEDTDKERSKNYYCENIIKCMNWLGLDWDGDIVYQSKNKTYHIELAEKLLSEKKAYKCYTSKQEIHEARIVAKKENRPYRHDRKWRSYEGNLNKPYVIRVKIPINKKTTLNDKILGEININNNELEDFVILRSDKSPTYMLSVVADDYLMGITNVIRGDDHLTNTFKQLILFDLFNWKKPSFSHIPLIHSQEGNKLSKRHGDLSVQQYKENKYLPEAILNYLLRLGWGHGNKEHFTKKEAVKYFSLKGVGKSPAKFDNKKLDNVNAYYFKKLSLNILKSEIKNVYKLNYLNEKSLNLLLLTFQDRSENLREFIDNIKYMLLGSEIMFSDQLKTIIKSTEKKVYKIIIKKLKSIDIWTDKIIEDNLKNIATELNIKLFNVAAPIRALVTGKTHSPSIFKILSLLGKEESIKRIKKVFLII